MLEFDPNDPFPLTRPGQWTYPQAQAHSRQVDAWLGLETEKIEAEIVANGPEGISPHRLGEMPEQLWIGLGVNALLTPYTECRTLVEQLRLKPEECVLDCGAGYGRLAFVMAKHAPSAHYLGVERVKERAEEGARCLKVRGCTHATLVAGDLTQLGGEFPSVDVYFIYDYGSRVAIDRTLLDIQSVARHRPVTVVGRGRASRDAIEQRHPWLSQVVTPEHFEHYSIYRTQERV